MAESGGAERHPFAPVRPRHVVVLFALAVIWSSSFFVIKIGVADMPAMSFAALRLVFAAAAMAMVPLALGRGLSRSPALWRAAFGIGLFGNALPFYLIGWGEQAIDSGLAAILMSVTPLTTVVLAHFYATDDRLTPTKLVGIGLGFAGIVVLVGPEALKGLGGDAPRQLATAAGAACYAVALIITHNAPPAPAVDKATATMLCSAAMIVPVAAVVDWPLAAPTTAATVAAAYLGVVATAFAGLLFFRLVDEREPSFISFLNYLVPVFGVGWGAAILGEAVTVEAVLALALVLVGIAIASCRGSGDARA